MDEPILFPLAILFLIMSFLGGAILSERSTKQDDFNACIKYHDQKTVVEADKLCRDILGRTK